MNSPGLLVIAVVAAGALASCATPAPLSGTCQTFASRHGVALGAPDETDWIADTSAFEFRWLATAERPAVTCSTVDGRVVRLSVGDQIYR